MMKCSLMRKFHNNDKGMSLVEILVAIGILSVAVAPLLYTFVYTTRFNAKAKVRQRAVNAAASVMENMKAYDLNKVYDMFSGATNESGDLIYSGSNAFLPNNSATYSCPSVNPSTKYGTYSITSMTFCDDDSGTNTYDVDITVSKGKQVAEIADTTVFDPTQDIIFEENTDTGNYYYNPYYVATEILNVNHIDPSDVSKIHIERKIDINISGNTADFIYNFPYSIMVIDNPIPITGEFSRPTVSKKTDGSSIRNIYFYYYPAYKDAVEDFLSEDDSFIVVIDSDGVFCANKSGNNALNLFVYKQKDSFMDNYRLIYCEDRYELNVAPSDSTSGSEGEYNKTYIYDCVQKNLGSNVVTSSFLTFYGHGHGYSDSQKALVELSSAKTPVKSKIDLTANIVVSVYDHVDTEAGETKGDPICTINGSIVK